MFLPGRSVQTERDRRQAAFREIEKLSQEIMGQELAADCTVSVQEIQCGDPNCAPIDTLVALQFTSGGQGMIGIPMEAYEVTKEILQQVFPPADILQKWHRGEDAAWPPEPEPLELRFEVGTDVLCRVGPTEWTAGVITQQWYRESGPAWPEGHYAPYKIRLQDGRDIFAPQDLDQIIRLNPAGNRNGVPGRQQQQQHLEDETASAEASA